MLLLAELFLVDCEFQSTAGTCVTIGSLIKNRDVNSFTSWLLFMLDFKCSGLFTLFFDFLKLIHLWISFFISEESGRTLQNFAHLRSFTLTGMQDFKVLSFGELDCVWHLVKIVDGTSPQEKMRCWLRYISKCFTGCPALKQILNRLNVFFLHDHGVHVVELLQVCWNGFEQTTWNFFPPFILEAEKRSGRHHDQTYKLRWVFEGCDFFHMLELKFLQAFHPCLIDLLEDPNSHCMLQWQFSREHTRLAGLYYLDRAGAGIFHIEQFIGLDLSEDFNMLPLRFGYGWHDGFSFQEASFLNSIFAKIKSGSNMSLLGQLLNLHVVRAIGLFLVQNSCPDHHQLSVEDVFVELLAVLVKLRVVDLLVLHHVSFGTAGISQHTVNITEHFTECFVDDLFGINQSVERFYRFGCFVRLQTTIVPVVDLVVEDVSVDRSLVQHKHVFDLLVFFPHVHQLVI